jgi:hypothetical protein
MGWLFGRKKKPKVPLPQPAPAGGETLSFPAAAAEEKVIQPEQVKEAAGVDAAPVEQPAEAAPAAEEAAPQVRAPATLQPSAPGEPLYVKMEVYQRVLGEFQNLKEKLGDLANINSQIEASEYNEESNFEKLRKQIQAIHDRLLQADRVVFKVQGD